MGADRLLKQGDPNIDEYAKCTENEKENIYYYTIWENLVFKL